MGNGGPMFPEYEVASSRLAREIIDMLMRARDPILGSIHYEPQAHMSLAASDPTVSGGYQAPIEPLPIEFEVKVDDLLHTSIDGWATCLSDAADGLLPHVMRQFFEAVGAASLQAGTTVEAKGRPFSHDLILEGFEKMDFDFDEHDRPVWPKIVVSPGTELGEPTPEQSERLKKIIEKKRMEFHARRRVRKLDRKPE